MIVKFRCHCGADQPSDGKYYHGMLGYEAIVCRRCGGFSDHMGEHVADEWSRSFVGLEARI
jgi:hypothetical protein